MCFQDIERFSPRKLGLRSYLQRKEKRFKVSMKMVLSCSISPKGNERMGIMDEVGNGHGLYQGTRKRRLLLDRGGQCSAHRQESTTWTMF